MHVSLSRNCNLRVDKLEVLNLISNDCKFFNVGI